MSDQPVYDNIIVVGSIMYDEIMNFPGRFVDYIQTDKLHQLNVSFVVDRLEKQLGGTGTNIAYNTRLLTSKGVTILSAIGKDGQQFTEFFTKNNLDQKGVLVDETFYTGTAKVVTDEQNNQIWGVYYGACEKAETIQLSQFVTKNSLVILTANHPKPFLHFQKQAIELGVDYMYDPGMVVTTIGKEDLRNGVFNARWFIGNDYEIAQILKITELDLPDYMAKGVGVITTLGDQGVRYQSREEELYVPAYITKETADPTGAGDAWRGGFLAGILEGKLIIESVKQGNALASFVIEQYGTVNHHPTVDDVLARAKML